MFRAINNISKFHYITHESIDYEHTEQVEIVCKAGCKWIQLRLKELSDDDSLKIALKTQKICNTYKSTFIINDNVHLAKNINADGVHLGKNDMSVKEARKILGDKAIIGSTANSFKDIISLHTEYIDYIGLGPFQFTKTKKVLSSIIGIKGYNEIIENCNKNKIDIPIIAIGGINNSHIASLLSTGIYGVAIASSIFSNENPEENTKSIISEIKNN